jgi:hypothetical protein
MDRFVPYTIPKEQTELPDPHTTRPCKFGPMAPRATPLHLAGAASPP